MEHLYKKAARYWGQPTVPGKTGAHRDVLGFGSIWHQTDLQDLYPYKLGRGDTHFLTPSITALRAIWQMRTLLHPWSPGNPADTDRIAAVLELASHASVNPGSPLRTTWVQLVSTTQVPPWQAASGAKTLVPAVRHRCGGRRCSWKLPWIHGPIRTAGKHNIQRAAKRRMHPPFPILTTISVMPKSAKVASSPASALWLCSSVSTAVAFSTHVMYMTIIRSHGRTLPTNTYLISLKL